MLKVLGLQSVRSRVENSHTYHISHRDLWQCLDRCSKETVDNVFSDPCTICASVWPIVCQSQKLERGTARSLTPTLYTQYNR